MAAIVDNPFEQLFEHARDPAFILDPLEDRIVAANPAGCAMLGYTREQLLATPVSEIHPAELPQLQEFLGGVLRDGHGSTIALTCRTRTGQYLPTEMSLWAFDNDGRVYVLGLIRDRSEHRHSSPAAEPSLGAHAAADAILGENDERSPGELSAPTRYGQ